MYGFSLDPKWVNLNNESDPNGDRLPPRFARNVRTLNGMIIGRVVRTAQGNDLQFISERYRMGEYVNVGQFDNADAAAQAVSEAK